MPRLQSCRSSEGGGQEGSGTRSSLLWECRRAIIAKRPRFLLLENVSNLVSEKFIATFRKWEQELASYGYDNRYKVLNSKDYGVPQNRERVFLVSFLDYQIFNFPQPIPLEKRLKDVLEDKVDERYYLSDKALAGLLEHNEKCEQRGTGFLFSPKDISVNGGGMPTASQRSQATRPEHTSSAKIIQVAKLSSSQNSIIVDPEGISPTICNGAKDGMPKILEAEVDVVGRVNGELCPTLTTHADRICRFEGMKGKRLRVRRLTERESFRLMGVRDSDISKIQETQFIAVSKNGKEKLSHITSTQQYAIAGNSIVVDVLDAIFEQMFYPVREEGQLF